MPSPLHGRSRAKPKGHNDPKARKGTETMIQACPWAICWRHNDPKARKGTETKLCGYLGRQLECHNDPKAARRVRPVLTGYAMKTKKRNQ